VLRSLAVSVAAVTLAGCGHAHESRPPAVSDHQWRSNATVIVHQLQVDIAGTQVSGATPEAAAAALRNESSLYGLLVSYSDFAGCREMVAAAGSLPKTEAVVDHLLTSGCRHLERASTLFTRAVTRDDGATLLAAGRESSRALPFLVRASAVLRGRR
jgi:hypothetical protein